MKSPTNENAPASDRGARKNDCLISRPQTPDLFKSEFKGYEDRRNAAACYKKRDKSKAGGPDYSGVMVTTEDLPSKVWVNIRERTGKNGHRYLTVELTVELRPWRDKRGKGRVVQKTLPVERWFEYIDSKLLWEKGELDCASYHAFIRAGSLGVADHLALAEVAERIRLAGDRPKEAKLKSQLSRAYAHAARDSQNRENLKLQIRRQKPVFQAYKLEKLARKIDYVIDDAWLWARSPITPWNRSPAGILHKLFHEGERVLVFTNYQTQGDIVWCHPGPSGNLAALDQLKTGCEQGVWFLANPVEGEWRELERLRSEHNPAGRTRRAEENITSWRYAVLESDKAPRDLWLNALFQLPLPIACVTDSGGDSIHALLRIDADSKTEWDRIVRRELLPALTELGADSQALTAVRLTRLGNCDRGEKGKLQRLLYLDPQPDAIPICQKPEREAPRAATQRLGQSLIRQGATL
jgi:hypothetical protein